MIAKHRQHLADLDVGRSEIFKEEPKADRWRNTLKRKLGPPQPGLEAAPEARDRPVAVEEPIDTVELEHLTNAQQSNSLLWHRSPCF